MDTTSLSFQTLAKPLQKRGGGEDCAERTRGGRTGHSSAGANELMFKWLQAHAKPM